MIVLGVNGGFSTPPSSGRERHRISDGSAALVDDGSIVCATIEERHTRVRYESGFQQSARICLDQGRAGEDVDTVAFSTCCGPRFTTADATEEIAGCLGPQFRHVRVMVVPHHESHAMFAFVGSRFERALVAVLDGMGNRTASANDRWWNGAFERQSYYLATWYEGLVRLELVDEDAAGIDELGIGEVYRAITHYVGFESYQQAGSVMAMAGFGQPSRVEPTTTFLAIRNGKIWSPMANQHDNPIEQVSGLLDPSFATTAPPAVPGSRAKPDQPLLDLVALLQAQVEQVVTERISALSQRLGVDQVCIAGGVALNCLSIGSLARLRPDLDIYVPPAPGDTGQGLGNALWATCREGVGLRGAAKKLRQRGIPDAGLGPQYSKSHWSRAAEELKQKRYLVSGPFTNLRDQARQIAHYLDKGRVVGLRHGRAEYGPRALGCSSIIADPRRQDSPDRVNRFKNREPYRPFAPCILSERQADIVDVAAPSPFMSIAGRIQPRFRSELIAVTHIDGSARYQTVRRDGPVMLRATLEQFAKLSGVPVLLNTSFNRAGAPMIETPLGAAESFHASSLDALSIGPYVVVKSE